MNLDGWLTRGVVTTGIYCRPSCPARPKPENVRVFEDVAANDAIELTQPVRLEKVQVAHQHTIKLHGCQLCFGLRMGHADKLAVHLLFYRSPQSARPAANVEDARRRPRHAREHGLVDGSVNHLLDLKAPRARPSP